MKFKILKYDPAKHELCGVLNDKESARLDPYVGCALAHDITTDVEGCVVELPDDVLRSADGTLLPSENEISFV